MKKNLAVTHVSKKILASAYKCISQKGYAKASLRDIADDAGVALSQLNYYYTNKEGLLTEVVKDLSKNYLKEIEERIQIGRTSKEKFNSLIEYFKTMMYEQQELFRLLFDLVSMSFWNASFKNLLSNLFNEVSDLIKKHILENHTFKNKATDFSKEIMAKSIVGSIFGIIFQYVLNPSDPTLIESLNYIDLSLEL